MWTAAWLWLHGGRKEQPSLALPTRDDYAAHHATLDALQADVASLQATLAALHIDAAGASPALHPQPLPPLPAGSTSAGDAVRGGGGVRFAVAEDAAPSSERVFARTPGAGVVTAAGKPIVHFAMFKDDDDDDDGSSGADPAAAADDAAAADRAPAEAGAPAEAAPAAAAAPAAMEMEVAPLPPPPPPAVPAEEARLAESGAGGGETRVRFVSPEWSEPRQNARPEFALGAVGDGGTGPRTPTRVAVQTPRTPRVRPSPGTMSSGRPFVFSRHSHSHAKTPLSPWLVSPFAPGSPHSPSPTSSPTRHTTRADPSPSPFVRRYNPGLEGSVGTPFRTPARSSTATGLDSDDEALFELNTPLITPSRAHTRLAFTPIRSLGAGPARSIDPSSLLEL